MATECRVAGVPAGPGGHRATSCHRMGGGPGIKRDYRVGSSHAAGGDYGFGGGKWIWSEIYCELGSVADLIFKV